MILRTNLNWLISQFNFVGKLLGPRGSSLKQLQASSMTKMAILGRGSMRNQEQVSCDWRTRGHVTSVPTSGWRRRSSCAPRRTRSTRT